jgi:hypothetical protein
VNLQLPFGDTYAVGRTLAIGVIRGRWTLEHLDAPPGQYRSVERDRIRSVNPAPAHSDSPTLRYLSSSDPYRNLARDWIQSNTAEWNTLVNEHNSQAAA